MAYIGDKKVLSVLRTITTESTPVYAGEVEINSGSILGQNLKGKIVKFTFTILDGVSVTDNQLFYVDENNKVEVSEIYDNYYYYDGVYFGGECRGLDGTSLDSITYTFPDDVDAIVTKHNTEFITLEILEVG